MLAKILSNPSAIFFELVVKYIKKRRNNILLLFPVFINILYYFNISKNLNFAIERFNNFN